jgi:L-fuconolactonase
VSRPAARKERRPPELDVVDAQLHMRTEVCETVAAMDAVGVESAVVDIAPAETRTLANGVVRYDYRFVEDAMDQFPGRFAYMARFDPDDPEIDDLMALARKAPGAVVVRITDAERLERGGDVRMLTAAARCEMPVMIYTHGRRGAVLEYVRKFHNVQFIIDHCGLDVHQFLPCAVSAHAPDMYIDELIPYAVFPNVAVKWSHAPRMSRESYPFRDVREQLARVVDAFGVNRLMWGSDRTMVNDHHTYAESLFSIRDSDLLSRSDKEWILGKTLRHLLKWRRREE